MTTPTISRDRIKAIAQREAAAFLSARPRSAELAEQTEQHYLFGVPLHWMADWGTPVPLFVERAQGAHFTDVDGHQYADFCLGDTGAMFGHSPLPVAKKLAEAAFTGYTAMLPTADAAQAGHALTERFGLPFWQLATTATDANRFVVRWARAITKRKKILVFNGCYHGTIDDVFVDLDANNPSAPPATRASLLGQVYDLTQFTDVVEFNDIKAVRAKLASKEFACVLTEPALTNCGMVLPADGFLADLRNACDETDTLLVFDETHTISAGYAGYTGLCDFKPDMVVAGKAIAGGLPCAVYGMSAVIAQRMREAKESAPPGHSGIGTTLSGNMLTMALLATNLTEVATPKAFEHIINQQNKLSTGLRSIIKQHNLPWSVTQLGARSEFQFCPTSPKNGSEAEAAMDAELEQAIHLYLLNRGIMITPFHNMTLVCPDTRDEDIEHFLNVFNECLTELVTN
ncbi:aspartate aminotransferase family protein [Hydromonas duriensis]|uniref:Glutamate-1-semialdehyde 2,1-aminomutase n=1 Tax=Hydromonas duriensis TaxID=1527608 RepID=A0A4R6Y1B0_9BURK|nr:aspartate aminotransferase family protein [Hydromonas duriensis]TDR29095.1 glutamate-1-semialdehyde 2,1-aminomutase [Hydromonas duriensis]